MIELSSLVASVTIRELGFFFFFRMAVAVSSSSFWSAPDASLKRVLEAVLLIWEVVQNLLKVDLTLLRGTLWICGHYDESVL